MARALPPQSQGDRLTPTDARGSALPEQQFPSVGIIHAVDQGHMIEESHKRSAAFGLEQDAKPDYTPLQKADLTYKVDQNRGLHTHAVPVMETLYEQIINTHNMVILTDAQGVILHTMGDDSFLEKADRIALKAGAA